ncbi:DUF1830 domain-containing protein [Nostoc sp.]
MVYLPTISTKFWRCYVNNTPNIKIVRIQNIPNWYF